MKIDSSFTYKISSTFEEALKEMYSTVAKAGITKSTNIIGIGKHGESLADIAQIQDQGNQQHAATNFIEGGLPKENTVSITTSTLTSKQSVRAFFSSFAQQWASGIKQYIRSQGEGSFDKLSQTTIINRRIRERRGTKTTNIGQNDRLIDTGTMLNAMSSEVRKKSRF